MNLRNTILWFIILFSNLLFAQNNRTITVTGYGESYAKPDVAIINIEIAVNNADITVALGESKQKIERLKNLFSIHNIKDDDYFTSMFNIYQERNNYNDDENYHYVVRHNMQIKYHKIENVGSFIEDLVKNGANRFSGISFDISDRTYLEKQARDEAVKNAFEKAKEMAHSAKVKLGKVMHISESSDNTISPLSSFRKMEIKEPESIAVSESISIVFEIIE